MPSLSFSLLPRQAHEFEGENPLVAAAGGGHAEAVVAILRAGSDPNRATRTGNTALRVAVTLGDGDCIAALLEGGGRFHPGCASADTR